MKTRVATIRSRLQALQPDSLDVSDQSHLHVGHPGARDGRGHFHVRIVAQRFAGKNPLSRHRMVYAALGDLMQSDIHALGIDALTPAEANQQQETQ